MPSQSPAERWAETSLHSWAAADMEGFSIGKKKKIAFDRSALPFVRERRPAGPVQQPQEVNEHFSAGSFISGSEGWECQRSIVPAEKEEKEATLVCPPSFFVCFCFNILACTTKCNSDRLSKLLCIKKAKQNPFLSVILTFRKALQIFFFIQNSKSILSHFFHVQ